MIREDGVINIKYPDNSSLTIHKDETETKIFTTDKDENNNIKYTFEIFFNIFIFNTFILSLFLY